MTKHPDNSAAHRRAKLHAAIKRTLERQAAESQAVPDGDNVKPHVVASEHSSPPHHEVAEPEQGVTENELSVAHDDQPHAEILGSHKSHAEISGSSEHEIEQKDVETLVIESVPESELPHLPKHDLPELFEPRRVSSYRDAASRAVNRPRSEAAPPMQREPISAESLGRSRINVRPRVRDLAPETIVEPVITPEPEPPPSEPITSVVAEPKPKRVRPRRTLPPAVVEALQPEAMPPPEIRRPPLWIALAAGIGWTILLVMLEFAKLNPFSPAPLKIIYGLLVLGVGLLTWLPLQWALRLPALTWRGTIGWGILLWMLAFAHTPTTRLVAGLPDLPVYLLLFGGIFLAVDALALPLTYGWGVRRYHNRRERFDLGRAQRQAAEVGLFVTLCVILAAMNILEPMTVLLLIAIFGLAEMVFLSITGE